MCTAVCRAGPVPLRILLGHAAGDRPARHSPTARVGQRGTAPAALERALRTIYRLQRSIELPLIYTAHFPGAWEEMRHRVTLPAQGQDGVTLVEDLMERISRHNLFPILEKDDVAEQAEECGAMDEEYAPFYLEYIPLDMGGGYWWSSQIAVSVPEALLFVLCHADAEDDESAYHRQEAVSVVRRQAAAMPAVLQATIDQLLESGLQTGNQTLALIVADAGGHLAALDVGDVGVLARYLARQTGWLYLDTPPEEWDEGGYDQVPWLLENVTYFAHEWAGAEEYRLRAEAVQHALNAPGLLERLIPALQSTLHPLLKERP